MAPAVHWLHAPTEEDVALLRELLDAGVMLTVGSELPEPANFDVLISGRAERKHLVASPNLHTLIIPWAGVPEALSKALADFPAVRVHNLHHNGPPVAELAMALLLAAAKFIVPYDQALRRDDWTPRYEPGPVALLEGKTALILGYGSIGRRVARACVGLGMRVIATRRRVEAGHDEWAEEIHPAGALPQLLPRADALIICLPLTTETAGLIGEAELRALPAGAVLVNVGRGNVVDESALYAALKEGRLRAAGLDVWYDYPDSVEARRHTPPASHPFRELRNVVMSPHRGGSSDETGRLRMTALAKLLNALAEGETAMNRVDMQSGY